MIKRTLYLALGLVSYSAWALPDYEPFANATGSGGTSYATGANLVGQTGVDGQSWTQAGPTGSVTPKIVSGDLTIPGLYSAGGGQSASFGGNGESARLNLSSSSTSGTIYYSFSMKLNDLTGMSSTGVFWAGLNNSTGTQTGTPSVVATRVITKSAGAGLYSIGLDKSSSVTGNFVFAPGTYSTSDTVFIVGSYTFNTVGNTTDDLSQLWVNPSSATFGAASAPGGSLSSTSGTDLAAVASFVLFDRNAAEPAAGQLDDLRIATDWADVTPVVPEPSVIALTAVGCLSVIGLRRMFRK